MLNRLPYEILWHILTLVAPTDLHQARHTSRVLRDLASHPTFWRNLKLPSERLWRVCDLKPVLVSHVEHIRSIKIEGVRDDVVRFLLSACPNLEHLELNGWTTLSDHALKYCSPRKLKSLQLLGPYTAIDAGALGRFVAQCPELSELTLSCLAHIHAPTLARTISISSQKQASSLRQLTLPTFFRADTPWQIDELWDVCPRLERLCLLSDSNVLLAHREQPPPRATHPSS